MIQSIFDLITLTLLQCDKCCKSRRAFWPLSPCHYAILEAFCFWLTRTYCSRDQDVCEPSRSVECLTPEAHGVLPRNSRDPLSPTRVGTPCRVRIEIVARWRGQRTNHMRPRYICMRETPARASRWWMNKYSRANKLRVTVGVHACMRTCAYHTRSFRWNYRCTPASFSRVSSIRCAPHTHVFAYQFSSNPVYRIDFKQEDWYMSIVVIFLIKIT